MKTKFLFILLIINAICVGLNAQDRIFKFANPGTEANIKFSKCDSLGNYYTAGSFNESLSYYGTTVDGSSNAEANSLFILKTWPNGRPVYLHSIYAGVGNNSINLQQIAINNKGELAILFKASSINEITIAGRNIPLSANESNQVVAKFSKKGYLIWLKRIRATGTQEDVLAQDIEMDETGNVYVTGHFYGDKALLGGYTLDGRGSYARMFLVKYNPDGGEEWVSSCDYNLTDTLPGGIYAYQIELGSDNRVYVCGEVDGSKEFSFGDSVVVNSGIYNAYLACFFTTGDVSWSNLYQGDGYIRPEMLAADDEGNVVFTTFYQSIDMRVNGQSYSSSTDYDIITSKYDSKGNSLWDFPLYTNLSFADPYSKSSFVGIGDSLDVLLACEYVQTGINRLFVLQFDANSGNVEWIKYSENVDNVYFANAVLDHRYNLLLAGTSYGNLGFDGNIAEDIFGSGVNYLCKFMDDGSVDYFYSKGNSSTDQIYFNTIGTDYFGNVYLSGSYNGTKVNLEQHSLSDANVNGIYIAKYSGIANISGSVYNFSGDPISGGFVKLLGYSYYQRCPISDSVTIQADGNYHFSNVPYGQYLLHAFPDETEGVAYRDVYFPSVGHWEEAAKIKIDAPVNYDNMFIFVPEVKEQNGEGRVQGLVEQIDETDVFKSTQKKPRAGTKASLARSKLKSDYEIIATAETDYLGYFYFENIEDGDYFILIEEPGLPNITVHAVTIKGNVYVSNVNYLMGEETIEAVGTPETQESGVDVQNQIDAIQVYPNPTSGYFSIISRGANLIQDILITALDGRQVLIRNSVNDNKADINLNPGIYLVHISTVNDDKIIKLIVKP